MNLLQRASTKPLTFLRRLLILALCWLAGLSVSRAQAVPDDKILDSLAQITVTGTRLTGDQSDKPAESKGTGFVISADGFVLTTYHIVQKLGKVVPGKVKFHVTIGDKSYEALAVNAVRELDLLLLKLQPKGSKLDLAPVTLGRADSLAQLDVLYSSGFSIRPNGTFDPHNHQDGKFDDRFGAAPFVWRITVPFSDGQSGSPIYKADGTVVGIAQGKDDNLEKTYFMIPIEYADSLISHIRMQQMQQQIDELTTIVGSQNEADIKAAKASLIERVKVVETNMDDIQTNVVWTGDMAGAALFLNYTKLVKSGPAIETIFVQITPLIYKKGGEPFADALIDEFEVNISENQGSGLDGKIRIPLVWSKIRDIIKPNLKRIEEFSDLKMSIVTKLNNTNLSKPQNITVALDSETRRRHQKMKDNPETVFEEPTN
jgi:Trypsin-like peptidase domain